ncbi:MAG: hypothetical protein PV340_02165 [Wolbachia sp.]|nr:hypothetical protein [Wolbachia sp.]
MYSDYIKKYSPGDLKSSVKFATYSLGICLAITFVSASIGPLLAIETSSTTLSSILFMPFYVNF